MVLPSFAYASDGSAQPYRWPIGISLAAHLILLGLLAYTPAWDDSPSYMPSVIDVQMVDLSAISPTPAQTKAPSEDAAPVEPSKTEPKETAPAAQAETAFDNPQASTGPDIGSIPQHTER